MRPTPPRAHLAWLFALPVLVGCEPEQAPPDGAAERDEPLAPLVEVLQARAGTLPLEERVGGVVRARNQLLVRAEIEGVVEEVLVSTGDAVEAGQPLLRLDDELLRDQLRQAEASVRFEEAAERGARARVSELEAQLRRTRALIERSLVSRLELDVLEAQLLGAQAAADQARARIEEASAVAGERGAALARTVVRAPIAGRIGLRRAEPGMRVDPSTPLFELGDLAAVVVDLPLTDAMLLRVEEGQPALITGAGLGGAPIQATLTRISPFLTPGSFSTTGEVDVDNAQGRLRPGMFVTVDLLCGESEEATLVPTSALWEDPASGAQGVFVLAPPPDLADVAALASRSCPVALRPVELRARGRASAGVRGVEPGEWVVTIGQHLLGRASRLARARPTTWERVLDLQSRQREELLRDFLARQQRFARERGATPPTTEEFLRGAVEAPPGDGGG